MRRCTARCSVSCPPTCWRASKAVSKQSEYIKNHGIPTRLFNAVRITLEGKVPAVRESQLLQLDSLRRRVSRAEKQVSEAEQGCHWR